MRPTFNRLFVLPDPAPEKFGSIHIPERLRDGTGSFGKGISGKVIAAGPGCQNHKTGSFMKIPDEIHPGVRVWYRKNAGTDVKVDGKTLNIITDDDVEAIDDI